MLTRRQALGAAVASVPMLGATDAPAQPQGEDVELARLAELEQVAVAAYARLEAVRALGAADRALLARFAAHEREHAEAVGALVEELGGRRPAKAVASDVERELPDLAGARTREQVLEVALALESALVAAYVAAHERLETARFLQLAAGIVGSQGQHLALLRQALGRPMLAGAFEDGKI